jgi:hypothetical protein
MTRKHTKRKHHSVSHPFDAIAASQPMPEDQVTRIMIKIHDSFAHLRSGGTDVDLYDRLAIVMNVGMVRSEEIGQAGVDVFKAGQLALIDADRFHSTHGRYGFTGRGLEAMREAVALYGEILAASSPLQMHQAQQEVMRRFRTGQVYSPKALAVETRA